MTRYLRPILQLDAARPEHAVTLAGGWAWFERLEVLRRGAAPDLIGLGSLSEEERARFSTPRSPMMGLDWNRPRIMGILNVTPDSFSDGGRYADCDRAIAQAGVMRAHGADVLDIGGESTRPGATEVPAEDEMARVLPVLRDLDGGGALSIDTRKASVARAAAEAGASLINDVSGLTHDRAMAEVVLETGLPVCIMHAKGDPATMQQDPQYDDVLLAVYDELARRIALAEAAGIARAQILIDPGIGFGKTLEHNIALLRGLALFHGLGCAILLGASRKKFIGTIGGAEAADARMPGSLAVALAGVAQGAQMLRVHDVAETRQALSLFEAVSGAGRATSEQET